MQIGAARMRPVVEIDRLEITHQTLLSDFTPADIAADRHWLEPRHIDPASGAFHLSQHAWLIEAGGRRILVDPCVGHMRQRPEIPYYHMIDSPLLDRLEAMGAPPESIDYVFCTHLHLDHVGWNTRLVDGRWVPTFRNARYLLPRVEEAFWRQDIEGGLPGFHVFNAGIYAECVQPVIEAGLADLVDAGMRFADCLTLIDAHRPHPGPHGGGAGKRGRGRGAVRRCDPPPDPGAPSRAARPAARFARGRHDPADAARPVRRPRLLARPGPLHGAARLQGAA